MKGERNLDLLCGSAKVKKSPLPPYDDLVCDFLNELSYELIHDKKAKQFSDIITFAFWARKANIQKKKKDFYSTSNGDYYLGRGIVFHIAPSNVPINFMYSYAFGLLAGNTNIIRIPEKTFPQIECLCEVLNKVLSMKKYRKIFDMTKIVRYGHVKEINDEFSAQCNVRVIWGGDQTIAEIRKSLLPPRSIDITFADRYSFGILSCKALLEISEEELNKLAKAFYNDTYLMDQNACSSPYLICWQKDGLSEKKIEHVKRRFWLEVASVATDYDLTDLKISQKLTMLYEKIMSCDNINTVMQFGNIVYVVQLNQVEKKDLPNLKGRFGFFYEYDFNDYQELSFLSDERVQTCAYYGIACKEVITYIVKNGFLGIDRIVPFGRTLDIDTQWDGYDLIIQMSRKIEI